MGTLLKEESSSLSLSIIALDIYTALLGNITKSYVPSSSSVVVVSSLSDSVLDSSSDAILKAIDSEVKIETMDSVIVMLLGSVSYVTI